MERFKDFSLRVYNAPKVDNICFQIGNFLEHLALVAFKNLIFDVVEFLVDPVKFYKRTFLQLS